MHFNFILLIPIVTTVGVVLAFIVSKTSRSQSRVAEPVRLEAPQVTAETHLYQQPPDGEQPPSRMQKQASLSSGPLGSVNGHVHSGQAHNPSPYVGEQS
ncbi:MAG: hypothetical protein M3014_00365 [Chloroflexota bacterium]|nr:hypothetical protein [Chloroflexota bacterium]